MKIFLTGGTGQVGFELQRSLSLWGDVLAPARHELDLSDMSAVNRWLEMYAPDCIVNAAAYTAVDKAEADMQTALCINRDLPCVLAQYAARHAIRIFHYSTDYVYDGSGHDARSEEAPTGPLNVYGRSKLAGDQAIMDSGASYVIFRTSWVYAARGNNFLKTMLRLAGQRDRLSVVADQIGAPTSARLLADITNIALARRDMPSGIYHAVCRGETSWHGFACQIFDTARAMGHALRLKNDAVQAITTKEYGAPAPRPLNSRLSVEKLEKTLGIRLPHWQESLSLTMAELALSPCNNNRHIDVH